MRKIAIFILFTCCFLSSCATTKVLKSDRYANMYSERPISVLVMPPINRSMNVEAKDLFYSSLIVPLSQKGYYVLPPLLTMEILKEESAYDAEMFANSSMKQVGVLFGVDAVLFTTIHEWSKTTILAQIRIVVEYTLKSAKTNEILFSRMGDITYSPQANSNTGSVLGDLLSNALSNMLTTAMTKEIEIGRRCNVYTLGDIPAGKYSPSWGLDGNSAAGAASFSVRLK